MAERAVDASRHVGLVGQIGSGAREVWGKAGARSVKGQHGTWAGGVRNVQGWLRPFGGWDGWSAHTISFLSDFFLRTLRCDRDLDQF